MILFRTAYRECVSGARPASLMMSCSADHVRERPALQMPLSRCCARVWAMMTGKTRSELDEVNMGSRCMKSVGGYTACGRCGQGQMEMMRGDIGGSGVKGVRVG